MSVETFIRLLDQIALEALLATARLVTRYQQDRFALRIKSEGYAPFAVSGGKAQFLHIGVPRAVKCIGARAAELRTELLEQEGESKNFLLHLLGQSVEFGLKLIANCNHPRHSRSMPSNASCRQVHDCAQHHVGQFVIP